MKGIILYKSKYGSTKRYAEWLKEETGFACSDIGQAKRKQLEAYDTVVLCGAIYASGIAGFKFFKRNYSWLKEKKIAVFCVGASPYDEPSFEAIKRHNLKDMDIPVFYGRGAWDEEKMTVRDRTLCRLLQKAVAKRDRDTLEPWMTALLCATGKKCDWTEKSYLQPLIDFLYKEN